MKKVLVVDDTKNIRLMLAKCLELEGFDVATANDGRQALDLFAREIFDLVFLDIKLPEVRGTEVLRRMRGMGIETPVIIITAYGTVKNAVDCTHMGAVAYLQKPFTAEKVRNVLQELNPGLAPECKTPDAADYLKQAEKLIGEGSWGEAVSLLKKAISLDPANAEVFLLLSKAYEGLGNSSAAGKFREAYQLFIK